MWPQWLKHIDGLGYGYGLGTQIPNPMAKVYYAEHVPIVQTWTPIPTSYFCIGQESESQSPEMCLSHNSNNV